MDLERWDRLSALFHSALALPEPGRRAYLETTCAGDPQLLADTLALLEEDARGDSMLDRGLARVAHDILDARVPVQRKIGPYRILKVLGRGGMGVVYLAERSDLDNRAAIKVLRDASLSPVRRARFRREQRVLANLSHSSITRLYDAGVLPDGTPYFVMEYVEGVPITVFCQAGRCPTTERLRLFHALCEAVHYAHRQSIIHCDLKPCNVLVAAGAGPAEASIKLLDFGIAKQVDALDPLFAPTKTELRFLTAAYAAPEQLRGEPVGTHTDVYGLGVILYELMTGRNPYDVAGLAPGQVDAVLPAMEQERRSGRAYRGGDGAAEIGSVGLSRRAWADLSALCRTAMQSDPQRRHATVDSLIRDLEHVQRGRRLEASRSRFSLR